MSLYSRRSVARAGLAALLLALPLAGCDDEPTNRLVVETGKAPDGFAGLPGGIGVRFVYRHGDWDGPRDLLFRGGHVAWTTFTYGPRMRAMTDYYRGPAGFPETMSGYRTGQGSVWEVSPDGGFLAVGATPAGSTETDSSLAIVDIEKRAVVAAIDGGAEWRVASLAWSPGGDYVAFIRYDWPEKSLLSRLFSDGMRDGYVSAWLMVADKSGAIVASTQLTREHETGAQVRWDR